MEIRITAPTDEQQHLPAATLIADAGLVSVQVNDAVFIGPSAWQVEARAWHLSADQQPVLELFLFHAPPLNGLRHTPARRLSLIWSAPQR